MSLKYEDIKNLQKIGKIGKVWTGADIAQEVEDEYPHQTLANHSACPCNLEKGYHCKINTKSHRFTRLGNGRYCLKEDSPDICPIHNKESRMCNNKSDEIESYIPDITIGSFKDNHNNGLISIVSNLRKEITNNDLNDSSVDYYIMELSKLGYKYNQEAYPPLNKTELFHTDVSISPKNLAEALLWKLGKWSSYKNFVRYYDGKDKEPQGTDIIFYAFAKHLRDNRDPIFDQHTLRAMWAIDSTLTIKESIECKKFLMNKEGTWKSNGSGNTAMSCYNLYIRFVKKIRIFCNDIKSLDMLLMPLGQALKKHTRNYDEFYTYLDLSNVDN